MQHVESGGLRWRSWKQGVESVSNFQRKRWRSWEKIFGPSLLIGIWRQAESVNLGVLYTVVLGTGNWSRVSFLTAWILEDNNECGEGFALWYGSINRCSSLLQIHESIYTISSHLLAIQRCQKINTKDWCYSTVSQLPRELQRGSYHSYA